MQTGSEITLFKEMIESTVNKGTVLSQTRINDVCIVMLPGMDGTGFMFEPLLQHLPPHFNHKIIPIPEANFTSHHELARAITNDLPEGKSVILAESFSGRTAYELCLLIPEKIIHVVLAASFLDNPNRLSSFSSYLPLSPLKSGLIPNWLLKKFLFGVEQPPIDLLRNSLSKIDSRWLSNRLKILAAMTAPKEQVSISCTIINALKDKLVSAQARQSIAHVFPSHTHHELNTGHFVLQGAPKEVATILEDAINEHIQR